MRLPSSGAITVVARFRTLRVHAKYVYSPLTSSRADIRDGLRPLMILSLYLTDQTIGMDFLKNHNLRLVEP